ncbi:MAG: 3-methyl-2-oxobutanoate dehydrogenase subunit beta [Mobilibacterium timonense]|uniref:transketolase C-terminal domain-containing protein n=2 Tax=Mobilibacterium timonense TaxID=1871012 RepID=UPI0009841C47|nr:transketolase C-terminal domain-containing protein [Mobilibacterium timonense]MBM6990056.1 3-methyl-2-oxobutanoate dehydrogenase subunit beta [Mobilibacterium timonense]
MEKRIMKGNEALAEGAVRGGCRFYAGYPITPQSEILEWMSWRQKEVGGVFIQGESEIASVNMTFAARSLGARALTSTSGPGFSLYQEGIAYWVSAGVPAVVACVQRFGIGDGFISAGQDNYWQAVKGGGNGDYHLITLAPNSVQENVDMAYESFALAEKWMHPVLILSDGTIGQMMEPCVLPPMVDYDMDQPWAVKGCKDGEKNKVITDITYFQDIDEWNAGYLKKMREISETEQRWESFCVEDADIVLVAYGISSRVAESAVHQAREEGFKLGLIRPITLWPYPRKAFKEIPDTCRGVITVEVNMMGQMRDDVIITVKGKFPTFALTTNQRIAKVDQVVQYAKDVYDGKIREEEVY